MATFDDKDHIDQFIKNNGWLDDCLDEKNAPDNPPAIRIVEYKTQEGNTAYGVVFDGELDIHRYERPSQFVRSPRVLWERA